MRASALVVSDRPNITVRPHTAGDDAAIRRISRRVYPDAEPWTAGYLALHRGAFPDGQLVAVDDDGTIVGMAASLIISWDDYDLGDSYRRLTEDGTFGNHDPSGRTLYGAEVMVDPGAQGRGVGSALYAARRDLCRRLRLIRIRAGARMPLYHQHAARLSPADYVIEVVRGRIADPTLVFQLRQGFRVLGVVENYIRDDPESGGHAAVIEWINEAIATPADYQARDPRFAPPAGLWPHIL